MGDTLGASAGNILVPRRRSSTEVFLCQDRFACLLSFASFSAVKSLANNLPAQRLGQAVQFNSIRFQGRSKIDYWCFRRLNLLLADSYPQVFSQLDIETINNVSLLIGWQGNKSELTPMFVIGHSGVVPVEPGTLQDRVYPTVGGAVTDERIYRRKTPDDKHSVLGRLKAADSLASQCVESMTMVGFTA